MGGEHATIPDRLNAISVEMLNLLAKALEEADRDRDVRAIVLTGAGRARRASPVAERGTSA